MGKPTVLTQGRARGVQYHHHRHRHRVYNCHLVIIEKKEERFIVDVDEQQRQQQQPFLDQINDLKINLLQMEEKKS